MRRGLRLQLAATCTCDQPGQHITLLRPRALRASEPSPAALARKPAGCRCGCRETADEAAVLEVLLSALLGLLLLLGSGPVSILVSPLVSARKQLDQNHETTARAVPICMGAEPRNETDCAGCADSEPTPPALAREAAGCRCDCRETADEAAVVLDVLLSALLGRLLLLGSGSVSILVSLLVSARKEVDQNHETTDDAVPTCIVSEPRNETDCVVCNDMPACNCSRAASATEFTADDAVGGDVET